MMQRGALMRAIAVAGGLLVLGLLLTGAAAAQSSDAVALEFKTMAGVSGPFVGAANPIRGVNGGGLPWAIDQGRGELRANGALEVKVKGLVLAAGAAVGTNPVPNFRAIVSCMTTVDGAPATANVATGLFPATVTGDAEIEAVLTLPSPCFAPIVFVTSPTQAWFAVTGL